MAADIATLRPELTSFSRSNLGAADRCFVLSGVPGSLLSRPDHSHLMLACCLRVCLGCSTSWTLCTVSLMGNHAFVVVHICEPNQVLSLVFAVYMPFQGVFCCQNTPVVVLSPTTASSLKLHKLYATHLASFRPGPLQRWSPVQRSFRCFSACRRRYRWQARAPTLQR